MRSMPQWEPHWRPKPKIRCMDWCVKVDGKAQLHVHVDESFLGWLGNQAPQLSVDPYRDMQLDTAALAFWRDELCLVGDRQAAALRTQLATRPDLPKDPEAREQVLASLVDRELGKDPHAATLKELLAAVELALETGGTISAFGD